MGAGVEVVVRRVAQTLGNLVGLLIVVNVIIGA